MQADLLRLQLRHFPAATLLGSSQVGKTTLALQLADSLPSFYLDLEAAAVRSRPAPGRDGGPLQVLV